MDGTLLPPFPTQKSQAVFAGLVLNRDRLVHRDVVCGWFWPEEPDRTARKALRTALWRMRSILESVPQSDELLSLEGPYVGLRPPSDRCWADVWQFEAALDCLSVGRDGALRAEDVRRLLEAERLYHGDLLAGSYDGWCQEQQERFRQARLSILERLVSHYVDRRDWLPAILMGRRLLHQDPLREHVHRAVIACHLAMGDRASAVRQYEECARRLDDDLGIEPMDETRGLLARGSGPAPSRSAVAGPDGLLVDTDELTLAELAREVEGTLRTLDVLTRQLQERTRTALGALPAEDRARESSAAVEH
jgi:DNA-binding SARP family transcriptional activator